MNPIALYISSASSRRPSTTGPTGPVDRCNHLGGLDHQRNVRKRWGYLCGVALFISWPICFDRRDQRLGFDYVPRTPEKRAGLFQRPAQKQRGYRRSAWSMKITISHGHEHNRAVFVRLQGLRGKHIFARHIEVWFRRFLREGSQENLRDWQQHFEQRHNDASPHRKSHADTA